MHRVVGIPDLTIYEELPDNDQDDNSPDDATGILINKQYGDTSPTQTNIHLFYRDEEAQMKRVRIYFSRISWGEI